MSLCWELGIELKMGEDGRWAECGGVGMSEKDAHTIQVKLDIRKCKYDSLSNVDSRNHI